VRQHSQSVVMDHLYKSFTSALVGEEVFQLPPSRIIASAIVLLSLPFLLFLQRKRKSRRNNKPQLDTWESHVLPHSPLQEIKTSNGRLWMVTGDFKPPRNMVVYKLKDGGLLLHSVVAMREEDQQKMEALGTPRVMIVPHGFHRLDAGVYKQRYPNIRVLCPASCRNAVEEVVKVDGTVEEELLSQYGVNFLKPAGLRSYARELAYEVELDNAGNSKALIICDMLFNLEASKSTWFARMMGSTTDGVQPRVSRLGKLVFVADTHLLKEWWKFVAQIPNLNIVCVAHGEPVVGNIAEKLHHVASHL